MEGAFDVRPDPTGRRVAYVIDGALHVQDLSPDGATGSGRVLADDDDPDIHWGVAEFVASEELERHRGYWWSPDGERIVAARVDERAVLTWYISSPVDPDSPPRAVRYPQAGTNNADVSLSVLGLDGSRVDIDWDREAFPYLIDVTWNDRCPLTLLVMSRDQKRWVVLEADPGSGKTQTHRSRTPPSTGTRSSPACLIGCATGGSCSSTSPRTPAASPSTASPRPRRDFRSPPCSTSGTTFSSRRTRIRRSCTCGAARAARCWTTRRLTTEPGMHLAARAADVTVVVSDLLDPSLRRVRVLRAGEQVAEISSLAETPVIEARPTFAVVGDRDIRVSIFTPDGVEPDAPLPVLLDPYGGPHFSRVVKVASSAPRVRNGSPIRGSRSSSRTAEARRGAASRGSTPSTAILAGPVLEDQVDALHAAADRFGFLDLEKVGIRGWSFGGYLAAMAVLRRPDVFHAAVAGAPDAEQVLYDTAYTERYLGLPQEEPEVYRTNSLIGRRAQPRETAPPDPRPRR